MSARFCRSLDRTIEPHNPDSTPFPLEVSSIVKHFKHIASGFTIQYTEVRFVLKRLKLGEVDGVKFLA